MYANPLINFRYCECLNIPKILNRKAVRCLNLSRLRSMFNIFPIEVSPSVLRMCAIQFYFTQSKSAEMALCICVGCRRKKANWEYVCISSVHSLQQSKTKAVFRHEWSGRVSCWARVYWIFFPLYAHDKHKLLAIFHVSSNGCSLSGRLFVIQSHRTDLIWWRLFFVFRV